MLSNFLHRNKTKQKRPFYKHTIIVVMGTRTWIYLIKSSSSSSLGFRKYKVYNMHSKLSYLIKPPCFYARSNLTIFAFSLAEQTAEIYDYPLYSLDVLYVLLAQLPQRNLCLGRIYISPDDLSNARIFPFIKQSCECWWWKSELIRGREF